MLLLSSKLFDTPSPDIVTHKIFSVNKKLYFNYPPKSINHHRNVISSVIVKTKMSELVLRPHIHFSLTLILPHRGRMVLVRCEFFPLKGLIVWKKPIGEY